MKDILILIRDQIKQALQGFRNDGCVMLAAGIAYFSLISLAPMFVIALQVATLFVDYGEGEAQLLAQLAAIIGKDGAEAIGSMIRSAHLDQLSPFMTILGILILLFASTTLFAKLAGALNTIFRSKKRKEKNTLLRVLRGRLLSLTMVVGIGFLLLISLIIDTIVVSAFNNITDFIQQRLAFLLASLEFFFSTALQGAIFGIIIKVMPEKQISWKNALAGGLSAAILFAVTKFVFGLFFGNQDIASSYGAAGAVVVILLWVFLAAVVLFVGAEYTAVLQRQKEKSIERENSSRNA